MNTKTLDQELKQLSASGMTVTLLNALDFVIPGSYHNSTNLRDMVQLQANQPKAIRTMNITKEAERLYAEDEGAQRAMQLYKLTDQADKAVAAAALANKVGSTFKALSFLTRFTPKADTVQTIDLCLKVTVEAMAYLSLHGMSLSGVGDWAKMVTQAETYSNESALRMAALIGVDGLIPLGPDFVSKVTDTITGSSMAWGDNALFKQISGFLPGGSVEEKASFIQGTFAAATTPIQSFIEKTGLTREKAIGQLKSFTDFSDDKLDYAAAFLDASTSYMTQTGVQTVARHFVGKAIETAPEGAIV